MKKVDTANLRPCPVVGCRKSVMPRQIMCHEDFYFVPDDVRRRIKSAKANPESTEYAAAVKEAVVAVNDAKMAQAERDRLVQDYELYAPVPKS